MSQETQQAPLATAPATDSDALFDAERRFNTIAAGRCEAPRLRDYQHKVIRAVDETIDSGKKHPLLVAATGAGKTVIGGEIVRKAAERGLRVLWLAHRRELIHQAADKLFRAGVDAALILADHPTRPLAPVQVASIATLHRRAKQTSIMEMPRADLVVIDEAHHAPADSYRAVIESYPDAIVLGLTATPSRADGRGLGRFFDVLLECPPVSELIKLGFLVPTRVFAPSDPELTGVKTSAGDYNKKQLAERMDKVELVGDIVSTWHRLAERRPTVAFLTSVAHSVHVRDELRRSGVLAEHIDGDTDPTERDRILRDFQAGKIEVICNCGVLLEGWDCPSVSCVVLARPTKSLGLFRQMVGRALRPHPGKIDAIVLDHSGATFRHGLIEEPIRWALTEDRKAINTVHSQRSEWAGTSLKACPECSAIRMSGKPCSACGWAPKPKPLAVPVRDGDLHPVDTQRRVHEQQHDVATRARWHAMLLSIANERGYRSGWVAHKFKEKFGTWPAARFATPITPDAEVRSWVRSRQIAFAREMDKRGAA